MNFKATLNTYQKRVESGIDQWVPSGDTKPSQLHEAMRYSIEAGGKRLRPVLVIATAELFEAEEDPIPAAVALECIHTYSLIHDDLPSLDNSDLRRRKPTCHKQFDEATALLAGDALLTLSFEILSKAYDQKPGLANNLVAELSKAAGSQRLIGGQMEDILGENSDYNENQLNYIHLNKTAALLTVAMTMGAKIAEASEEDLQKVTLLGRNLGLAFQITDDILDATSDKETLGKPTGADQEHEKTTFIKLFGLDGARAQVEKNTESANALCKQVSGDSSFLEALVGYLEHRLN